MVDITPTTDADSEASVGDEVEITYTLDTNVIDRTEIEFVIIPSGGSKTTEDGTQATETDNGDGTFSYAIKHTLESTYTKGRCTLSSDAQGDENTNWYITAQPKTD